MSKHPNQAISSDGRYGAVTQNIRVLVEPVYLDEQSEPEAGRFVWAYTIEIRNEGTDTVQLMDRFWEITDANGKVELVHGPGVVGEQPVLRPGEAFKYTSGCPLATESGFMVGRYTMQSKSNRNFEVDIPAFALDLPRSRRVMN